MKKKYMVGFINKNGVIYNTKEHKDYTEAFTHYCKICFDADLTHNLIKAFSDYNISKCGVCVRNNTFIFDCEFISDAEHTIAYTTIKRSINLNILNE